MYNFVQTLTNTISLDRLIISHDFNYDYQRDIVSGTGNFKTFAMWVHYLQENFHNCLQTHDMDRLPTFQRNTSIHSSIDYIYTSLPLQHLLTESSLSYLGSTWSDHTLISSSFNFGPSKMGPELFRENPGDASNPKFQQQLASAIDRLLDTINPDLSPQDQWELVKTVAIKIVKTFGVKYVCWRQQSLKHLQHKRNRLLRSKPPVATLEHFLPKIEKMLKTLQVELVKVAALKAGMVWREQGERSAKFLKNVHQLRENQQYIGTLQPTEETQNPPSTSERTEHPPSSTASSDPATVCQYARQFYKQLYTADPVDNAQLQDYLASIHFDRQISSDAQESLTEPISIEDLIEQASRNGNNISSPGSDDLGYPFPLHLFRHPRLQELSVQVYNQAMQGVFPSTWQDLRVRLLPKKGDLSTLKNWRPISLINCDAKVFTRILTKRLGPPLDHGMALSLILEQARGFRLPGVGLLLDQETAYDRVHPGYLRSVMVKFNFPAQFITFIQDPQLHGISLSPSPTGVFSLNSSSVPPITCLAYDDDVCLLLSNPTELRHASIHMRNYAAVSNAKFNDNKTEVFSLQSPWDHTWDTPLHDMRITTFHHQGSKQPFRYLGFYIPYNSRQRKIVEDQLILKVQQQCILYSQR
ncbi:hypothetical protein G6F46_010634 [Rhizopus delemar]|uniref:Reverse transcriptase domain-containing protein n=2 Tax=Rhizopus TaxID=4842 RepID=A0A9P6YVM2_9FUNG|nr:hypothetical protein G6F55_009587 [Rhizopus delemar]KAG1537639.1 hypothetical protein G6F51_010252 [Rhizopus arrhizus]KAG1491352.1 hypothetical protein G6F54_010080 [Rhizopus delemar]KAG1506011.1 hypothetical protein G6F53_009999 [Rhizopus delemar]KAG1521106.1 hypothetical protein G6F52_007041 [Rhizopus delemar]